MTTIKLKSGREWEVTSSKHYQWVGFVSKPLKGEFIVTGKGEIIGEFPAAYADDLPELIAHAKTILKGKVE